MSNNIALSKTYTANLDEVYKRASVTRDLIGDPAMVRAGIKAREIVYPQIDVSGLGDYDRNSGYTNGSVNLAWKTAEYNYDRGTKLSVDVEDTQHCVWYGRRGAGAHQSGAGGRCVHVCTTCRHGWHLPG